MKGTPLYQQLIAGPNDDWDIPIADQGQIAGGLKIFATQDDLDAWAAKYPSRLPMTVAFVLSNRAISEPEAFKWDGNKFAHFELGTQDIPAQGISIDNPDGSTTADITNFKLDGLVLEGDSQNGFTLKSLGGGAGKVTIGEALSKNYAQYDVGEINFRDPLEVVPARQGPDKPIDSVVVGIRPGTFETIATPGILSYLQYPVEIVGKNATQGKYNSGAVFFDMHVTPRGQFIYDEADDKAWVLQEFDGKDPNVTGGNAFLVWPFLRLEGNAPDDGYVEVVLVEKDSGAIATDVNGNPMAVRRNYKAGQPLTLAHEFITFAQVIMATGFTRYRVCVSDSFTDDVLKILDYAEGPSGICIQALTDDGATSTSLIQAELDTGLDVRVEKYYLGNYLGGIEYLRREDMPTSVVKKGSYYKSVDGLALYAACDTDVLISNGQLIINCVGMDICDFYLSLMMKPEQVRMLQGQDIDINVALQDKDDAWNVSLFRYDGDMTKEIPPIYKSRKNGSVILEKGWSLVDTNFISEDAVSGIHAQTFTSTVPKDMVYGEIAFYPVSAQSPMNLILQKYDWGAATTGYKYEISGMNVVGLQHLHWMTEVNTLTQGLNINRGWSALRYTGNDRDQPLPMGVEKIPFKYLEWKKDVNQIQGSAANGAGEGVLVAKERMNVTINQRLLLWREKAGTADVKVWLVKWSTGGQQTIIAGSEVTFTAEGNRPGIDYFSTNQVTFQLEPGEYFGALWHCSEDDGAYIQTSGGSNPCVQTFITEKLLA
ncbi:MAG: hypothetical protein ACRCVX_02350 [Shewanella sp.]